MSKGPSLATELALLRQAATSLYKAGPMAPRAAWEALRKALNIPEGLTPGRVNGSSDHGSRV